MEIMKLLAPALIITFAGIAVFGFMAMGHGIGETGHSCLASTAQAINCSSGSDVLAFIGFHAGAFKSFSMATFSGLAASIILLIALAYFALSRRSLTDSIIPISRFTERFITANQKQSLISWLSFHENSPSLI